MGKVSFSSTKEVNKNGSEKQDILVIFLETLWVWHRGANVEVKLSS